MAEITSDMIKALRETTQAGMVDCKKALQETGGDMQKAIEFLRKKRTGFRRQKNGPRGNRRHRRLLHSQQ